MFFGPYCSQRPRPRSLRPWLVLLVWGATWLPRERPSSSTSSDDGASKSASGGYRGVEPAVDMWFHHPHAAALLPPPSACGAGAVCALPSTHLWRGIFFYFFLHPPSICVADFVSFFFLCGIRIRRRRALLPAAPRPRASGRPAALLSSPALDVRLPTALQVLQIPTRYLPTYQIGGLSTLAGSYAIGR